MTEPAPSVFRRDLEQFWTSAAALAELLSAKPHLKNALEVMARTFAGPWQEIAVCDGPAQLDVLARLAIANRRYQGKRTLCPNTSASQNPALIGLVQSLIHYWEKTIKGPSGNSVDETKDPPKLSSMTAFVKAALAVAGATDRNGGEFSDLAVHQQIKRARKTMINV